ncbi:Acidic leucine-rich nuclear phosphoprotein 32 like protein, partial [Aduncisulcus paluster]
MTTQSLNYEFRSAQSSCPNSSSISTLHILIFLIFLSSSFQSVLSAEFSEECSMYLSEDDHFVCNEVYPGRYTAECEDGYYYNEATYSCDIEDTTYQCPTINDEYHMCILADGDSSLSLGCRSVWYGDDCDQLYSVHIPDKLFRGKVCDAAGYDITVDPLCDVSEFEMAGINEQFNCGNAHTTTLEAAQNLINVYSYYVNNTDITSVQVLSELTQLCYLTIVLWGPNYSMKLTDFNSLYPLNRLFTLRLYGNDQVYDISLSFKSVALRSLIIGYYENEMIPLCRSESNEDFISFLTTVFPTHDQDTDNIAQFHTSNSCPLNITDDYFCSQDTYPDKCPSIVLNEVYNSVDEADYKECSFIAKTSGSVIDGDLKCYTVHDDNVREYLINECLPNGSDDLDSGIISVATMRSVLSCPSSSLSLQDIATASSLASVNALTTLQGLEYATSLTSLTLDEYDLSGDSNSNAEYDKLVVQILAKAVTISNDYGSVNSGLASLSASECGLSNIGDVLDLTPIASGDSTTDKFKLTSLDLSNNSISDVSVLITSSMFPDDTDAVLTTLDISGNSICDIEGIVSQLQTKFPTLSTLTYSDQTCHCSASVSSAAHQVGNSICDIEGIVSQLQTKFPTLSTLTYSDQTCHCSASVSSAAHQVCREVYPDRWAVECWHGYYLDKSTRECVEATDSSDIIRCQVCEGHSNMMPVLEVGASSITCGCRSAWYGDDCDELYQVYIPDELFRGKVCDAAGYDITIDPLCDVSEFEMAGINGYFYSYGSHITSFEGAQYLINLTSFSGPNTDVTSVYPISFLGQLSYLFFHQTSTTFNGNIYDLNSLFTLNRLYRLAIYGDEQIYDISVSFRNAGLDYISIAYTDYSAFIPLCRSEDDTDYWTFITTVFPIHSSGTYKDTYYIPNSCALNNVDDYVCDSETYPTQCPSIVLNEVYNSVDDVNEKQCAFIAKEGTSGECYTVHDDSIRQYLKDHCLSSSNVESNGVISVATMRSVLSCPLDTNSNESLSLPDIASAASLSSVNSITTLQGLEYATSLTSLTLDGYDLSGDSNSNAEYDKLVVQILAKAVTSGTIDSGLRILSASGCGLSAISDVLDLTPIASGDPGTDKFKLISLDLSNNSISDVSVLITSSMFPEDVLTTLDISGNFICDIDGMVSQLQDNFTIFSLTYDNQTCNCTMPISSEDHQVCREVYPGRWDVECWNGYYYDIDNDICVKATNSGDIIRCQVCERDPHRRPILESGASAITCGCRSAWYGDDCESLYQVHVPSPWLRKGMCYYLGFELTLCDFSEFEAAGYSGSVSNSDGFSPVTTPEGLHYMINVSDVALFNISPVSALEFSLMPQLTSLLYLNNYPSLHDFAVYEYPTPNMHRLSSLAIRGAYLLFDISMFYRNIALSELSLADTSLLSYTAYCRSENDSTFIGFITSVFGRITDSDTETYVVPNDCPINDTSEYYCSNNSNCPSIVRNEVYNNILVQKECSSIAKIGSSGECYTVHDNMIRSYLTSNCSVTAESNGVLSVASLRSDMTCTSLTLTDVYVDISVITTLQGLEYTQGLDTDGNAVGLTSLTLDGYDLSGDNDVSAYDQIVVQILAKSVSYLNDINESIVFGLTSLSASECGLSNIGDVLDLTPIASGDPTTDKFKLISLDLSNNSISDVSVLITSSMFPDDTDAVLTTLDISDNNICDIEGIVSQLQTEFPTLSTLTYSDQTCHCSASVSSAAHQVCREVYPDRWAVECWNGYYLDKSTRECVEATDYSDIIRCQVCEGHSNMMPVLEVGASSITCGCRSAWYGDDCDQLYSVHIPDKLFRGKVCDAISNSDPLCDVTEFEMAGISGIFNSYSSHITSFEGAQYLINISNFRGDNTDVTSVYPIPFLEQLPILYFYQYSTAYNVNIYDFNSLFTLNRFYGLYIYGNEQIYDISVSFRNVGLYYMGIASKFDFIPLCRSEDDTDYWTFITTVFPIHYSASNKLKLFIPNSCALNNVDDYVCDSETYPTQCPSIVLNEVYNSVADPAVKECAFIAKSSDGKCYTVHDDYIRQYLVANCLPGGTNDLDSGIISVATMRSILTCPLDANSNESLSLPAIASAASLSSVNSITTLQGLEYATSLTSLTLDGYDLSGDSNSNAEYDKLVVQILAKAVTSGTIDSGLRILSASGCGLSAISDVLDLTPIASGDPGTDKFKLISLDLSNNSISDVSVLITSSMFPDDTDTVLTTLDISGNSICDIDSVTTNLLSYFTNLTSLSVSNQSRCRCSEGADVSFSAHKTCRQRSDGYYQVECWHGYYLDKETNTCVKAVASENSIRCQVCEMKDIFVPILDINSSVVSCGCSFGFHGDSCEYVDIPDSNLRSAVCLSVVNPSAHDSSCDDLTLSDMATVTSVSVSIVDSFEGLQSAVNLTSLSISGTSSSSVSIGNTDLGYLPLSLVELSLEAVYLDSNCEFNIFGYLTALSVKNNPYYDVPDSTYLPSSSYFTSLDVSYTALSSFASIPTTVSIIYANGCNIPANTDFSTFANLTTLSLNDNPSFDITESDLFPSPSSLTSFSANNTSISLLFHLVASMPNLTELSLNNNNISDPSPLYALSSSGSWSSIDLSYNHICGGDNGDSEIEIFLASKFSLSTADVNVTGQDCICSSGDLGSTPLASNKVCSETKPGSGSWYVVCASDSYTSYTSAKDFTCMQTTSPTTNCSGGCEYGYECRYLGDEVIGDDTFTTGECQQVIVDENLHDVIYGLFEGSDLHCDATDQIFSVASLRTISTSTLSNDGFALSNSDRFSLLDGIEHIRSLTSISLPYHNFVSADPLGSLYSLESLSLAHNMYGAPEDAGGNDIEGFSDLSFICSLHSLSTLTLSSVTSVSALPDTSECADTYTSLSSLNLAETSIIDVSALLVAADSTNVSLTELIMNGVSLYDDVAETTSLFDPSVLV